MTARKAKDFMLKLMIWFAVIFTVAILGILLYNIFSKGFAAVNWEFITGNYSRLHETYGIKNMILTTVYIIGLTLLIAVPISILAAIYLAEYAKPGKLLDLIRFTTESLAGIPSIIYGLFGYIFFVIILRMRYSILAGALTLSIMVLPIIIRTTEESIKATPKTFKEGSLALGATKLYTLYKIILPSAMPGIITSVILSIGRIVGESAALIFTAGMVSRLPGGIFDSGRTLAVHMYALFAEGYASDQAQCWGTAVVLVILIIIINLIANLVGKGLKKDTQV